MAWRFSSQLTIIYFAKASPIIRIHPSLIYSYLASKAQLFAETGDHTLASLAVLGFEGYDFCETAGF